MARNIHDRNCNNQVKSMFSMFVASYIVIPAGRNSTFNQLTVFIRRQDVYFKIS